MNMPAAWVRGVAAALLLQALAPWPTAAAAESEQACTPVTQYWARIQAPGVYCLTQDLSWGLPGPPGGSFLPALEISSNDVVLDCNGYYIDVGPTDSGIYAVGDRITIRNCDVGPTYEVLYLSGRHGLVEDNRFVSPVTVRGNGAVVRRNRIAMDYGTGLAVSGLAVVEDNQIERPSTPMAITTGRVVALSITDNPGGTVRNNRVHGNFTPSGSARADAIVVASSPRLTITGNQVKGAGANTYGITCDSAQARARDNLVIGAANPLVACANAGGNDLTP